ncbi:MAG: hypothetical protein AAF788_02600, partial [Pseudomonadota bacterium]
MAEAAKRPSLRLPRGVKRATLKPQGTGPDGKPLQNAMSFAPDAEDEQTNRDFDAILQEVLKDSQAASESNLSQQDQDAAAALAKRLAERVLKARGEPVDDAPSTDVQQAAPPAPVPEDELVEPLDIQKLIQAREALTDLMPMRAESSEGPIDTIEERPVLKQLTPEDFDDDPPPMPHPFAEEPKAEEASPFAKALAEAD